MKINKTVLLTSLILIAGLLFYVVWTLVSFVPEQTPIKTPDINTMPKRLYGVIEPAERAVFISPPLEKRVDSILVQAGDLIKKGQPLLILDHADEKSRVEVAKAEVEQRKARVALSEDKFTRNEALFAKQVINESDFVQLKLDLDIEKALLNVAEKNLQEAEVRLDQLTLKSPIDGKVYRMDVHVGQTFKFGDKTFVIGKDNLWVNLRVESFWINQIHEGTYKVYHADTDEYLGDATFVRAGLFMGPPNFYIQDPNVMTDIKYLEVFAALTPKHNNLPIELIIYADKRD